MRLISRFRDSSEMVRECSAIQWVSTAVQLKYFHLYPIELTTRNGVRAFLGSTFCRSIPKHKHQEIAREYPKPDLPAAKVLKIDSDIMGTRIAPAYANIFMHTRLPPRAERDPARELSCALSSEAIRAEQRGSGSPSILLWTLSLR